MDTNIESAKQTILNLFNPKILNNKKIKGTGKFPEPSFADHPLNMYNYTYNNDIPKPKTKKPPAKVKSEIIMKASSMSKNKEDNNRPAVDTDMNIKKGITDKMKRALKKSVINSLENELKGSGFIVDSDTSSDEEIITIKRRGRPKKKTI